MPAETAVKGQGIARQQSAYYGGGGDAAGPQQQVKVVGLEVTSIPGRLDLSQDEIQTPHKVVTVDIISKNLTAFNLTHHDVVNCIRGINSCFAWNDPMR